MTLVHYISNKFFALILIGRKKGNISNELEQKMYITLGTKY